MKKNTGFWRGLEKYGWKVVERSPLPYAWIAMGIWGLILGASWGQVRYSVVGARNVNEVVAKAASLGDYETARKLLNHYTNEPLNHLEDLVYPERIVERRIAELEAKLTEYPGNRQIYLALGELYGQLGNGEKADEYRERARILDPNN